MAFVHIGGQGVWIDDGSADSHPRCMLYSLPGLADLQLAPPGCNKTHAMHIANLIIAGVFTINIVLMDVKIILAKSIEVRVIEVRGLAPVATFAMHIANFIIVGVFVINIVLMDVKIILAKSIEVIHCCTGLARIHICICDHVANDLNIIIPM